MQVKQVLIRVAAMTIVIMPLARADQAEVKEEQGKVAASAALATKAAAATLVARAMVFNALKNAMAALDDQQVAYVSALRGGEKAEILKAKEALEKALERVIDVGEDVDEVCRGAAEAGSCAEACRLAVGEVMELDSRSKIAKIGRKVSKFASVAEKAREKAEGLAQELKEIWLIPEEPISTEDATQGEGAGAKSGDDPEGKPKGNIKHRVLEKP